MVVEVKSQSEFNTTIQSPKLTVVDFFAEWCGPCKAIAPYVDELSKKYPNVNFIKVDVDRLQELASASSVSAMPTFQFYKNGKKISEFRGADKAQLLTTVQQHATPAAGFPSSGGQRLGSADDSDKAPTTSHAAHIRPAAAAAAATATATATAANTNSNMSAIILILIVAVFFVIAYLRGHTADEI